MRADHRHCLATPASRWRCAVLEQREELTRVTEDQRSTCAGRSLVQRMEDRLDELVAKLMILNVTTAGVATEEKVSLAGEAQGVSECIALVRFPYEATETAVASVKAAAMQRYQASLTAAIGGAA